MYIISNRPISPYLKKNLTKKNCFQNGSKKKSPKLVTCFFYLVIGFISSQAELSSFIMSDTVFKCSVSLFPTAFNIAF